MMRASIGAAVLAAVTTICAPTSPLRAEPAPAAAPTAAAPANAAATTTTEPSLDQLRAATARFKDVKVALAEGYIRDPGNMCETADMMGLPASDGAMGIHFFRPDLLGITAPPNPRVNGNGTHTDFSKPAILLYEPQADGSLALVGVENLVFDAAWKAAGKGDFPTYQGQKFNAMADDPATKLDEAHGFEPHHDLHVWVHRENPRGTFESFNPAVSCAHHKRDHAMGDMKH